MDARAMIIPQANKFSSKQPEPTVFVVEDDQPVLLAIESLLLSEGLSVKLFCSARDLLAEITPDSPGCLLLDVRLPGESGLELQQELINNHIHLPILFLTGYGDIRMSVQAMKAGAVEFLTKPVNESELLNAIHQSLAKDRIDRANREARLCLQRKFDCLTPREREIMHFVVSGLLNKQIAAEVGLSEITVKVHRRNVMRKIGAHSLADLTRIAECLADSPAL